MVQNGTVSSSGADARGGPLDALRFVAAAFVVLYHFGGDAPAALERLAPVLGRGWPATDFFIMLSGYVLGRAYGSGLDAGRTGLAQFLGRRLTRIWPAHLIVLAGFAGLIGLCGLAGVGPDHPGRYGAGAFLAQAGLVHAWGYVHTASWNVPSWTLSALAVCYALFAPAWAATRRLQGRTAALLLAFDVLAVAALAGRLLLHRSLWDLPFDLGVIRAVPLFLCGLLLARAAAGLQLKRGEAVLVATGGATALVLFQTAARGDLTDLGTMTALAFAILGVDALKGVKLRWAKQGAALSFALFVTHALAGAVWFGALHALERRYALGEPLRWALWAGGPAFALAVAWAFDRWIDQPVQRLLRARLATAAPARATPAPAGT